MKHYLYKAKTLVLIYSLVSMLFILGSMAFFANAETAKPFPELSDDSIVGVVSLSDGEGNRKLYDALIEAGVSNQERFILATQFNSIKSAAVYYTDPGMFAVDLLEGRIFSAEDFANRDNVVIVDEEVRASCDVHDGAAWWKYSGDEYKVIGVYRQGDFGGSFTNHCYINLSSSNLNPDIFSNFIFDAKVDSDKVFARIIQSVEKQYQHMLVEYAPVIEDIKDGKYLNRSTNFKSMELMLIVTGVLVLLNSISVSMNWLLWYRKEIGVRKLCGASLRAINMWIVRKFILYIIISGFIGFLCVNLFVMVTKHLPVSDSVQMMFGSRVTPQSVFAGMGCVMILCGIIIAIIMYLYNRQKISETIK